MPPAISSGPTTSCVSRADPLAASLPDRADNSSISTVIGRRPARPGLAGSAARPATGPPSAAITPLSAAYTTNVSTLASSENVRSANSARGVPADQPTARWRSTKHGQPEHADHPRRPAPPGLLMPRLGTSTMQRREPGETQARPTAELTRSGRPGPVRVRRLGPRNARRPARCTTTATGGLIRNASRQDHAWISTPPTSGPGPRVATPDSPDHAPDRPGPGPSRANEDSRMASAPGVEAGPPPTPLQNPAPRPGRPMFGRDPAQQRWPRRTRRPRSDRTRRRPRSGRRASRR